MIGGAGRDELLARLDDSASKGRGGHVHHDLGAARRSAKRGTVGDPEVLADLDGESAEGEPEEQVAEGNAVDRRHPARNSESEDPALVEHVVVRKVLLRDDPDDLSRGHHRDGVVEKTPVGHGEPDGEDGGERRASPSPSANSRSARNCALTKPGHCTRSSVG